MKYRSGIEADSSGLPIVGYSVDDYGAQSSDVGRSCHH